MRFMCPYCGALKDRLRLAGAIDHDGPPLAFVVCNNCLGTIAFAPNGDPATVRMATDEELAEIVATKLGKHSFEHALLKRAGA
ncbi:MAG TPA: hypothetical protein VGG29_20720 [Caulobacteraceae bacterium]|jgi:hypothetical protein